MILKNKSEYLNIYSQFLPYILNVFDNLNSYNLNNFEKNSTVLIVVDIINGFAKKGTLYSPNIENLIDPIYDKIKIANNLTIPVLAFADCHDTNAVEFENYPPHCIKNTDECKIVDKIHENCEYALINKNSTNGFFSPEFKDFLINNTNISNFIIIGDCTDICISQLALTLKAYFNNQNLKSNIIVPLNLVDTYDLNEHNSDLMNIISLYTMHLNGIDIIKNLL